MWIEQGLAGCDSCFVTSVTTISKIFGCPSAIRERWLLDNVVRSDNSIRCIAVSIRRSDWPRTKTSCVTKTNRRFWFSPSRLSLAKTNSSCGSNGDSSAVISTRTPRACGSFAQHSGDFVLIFLSGLLSLPADKRQPDEIVGSATAKAEYHRNLICGGLFHGGGRIGNGT